MNWYFLAACVLGLSGCGDDSVSRSPIVNGDEYLISYLTKFVADGQARGKTVPMRDLNITFGVTKSVAKPNQIGYCQHSSLGLFIVVDQDWFENAADYDREALMYHEFGHCLLDLGHNETCLVFSGPNCLKPLSLMYPQLISGVYGSDPEGYLDQLFGEMP